MAIGLGVNVMAFSVSATSITTAAVTTQSSGSTLWLGGLLAQAGFTSFSDSKSNTYTQNGATQNYAGAAGEGRRARKVNATGGTSHTFTLTLSFAGFCTIFMIEATGANTTESLDQANQIEDTTSPFDSPAVNTTVADEILFGLAGDDATSPTHTAGQSFTKLDDQSNSDGGTGCSAYRIVSATGSYFSSFTMTGSPTSVATSIDTFKEAGGPVPPIPYTRINLLLRL